VGHFVLQGLHCMSRTAVHCALMYWPGAHWVVQSVQTGAGLMASHPPEMYWCDGHVPLHPSHTVSSNSVLPSQPTACLPTPHHSLQATHDGLAGGGIAARHRGR